MSWCRWSTVCENKMTSDLYVYDDVRGGVTIHVAGRRVVGVENAPQEPPLTKETIEDGSYMAAHRARMEWYENNQNYENIQSDLAGQTYNYDDAESLVDFFTLARQEGLVFPDWLFELAKEYKAESDDPA
jgi:hypothetical protein